MKSILFNQFHDADFYVLSKDPLESYEPYLPQAETHRFKAHIFPPRKKRSDSAYQLVKNAVMDWLKENETVNATEIYENYGIRRQTAGKHFKEMSNVGILEKVCKTKYKLPSQVNNGHDILYS